jgi:hypothetical protein
MYAGQTSLEVCYRRLLKLSDNSPEIAKQIIEMSISSNYTGFFALNDREMKKAKSTSGNSDEFMQKMLNNLNSKK